MQKWPAKILCACCHFKCSIRGLAKYPQCFEQLYIFPKLVITVRRLLGVPASFDCLAVLCKLIPDARTLTCEQN